MKAMMLYRYGERLALDEVPVPSPHPGELLVQVKATGLCGTDLKIIQGKLSIGPPPHVLGHEIAGVVAGRGEGVDAGWLGKRVALHLYCACGKCRACRRGEYNMCDDLPGRLGFELPGGLAEYVTSPSRCAVELPPGMSFEEACVAPCAMLTIHHAIRRARVEPGDMVALIGVGGLGIHGVQLLAGMGNEVTAVDVVDAKLEFARKMGASQALTFDAFQRGGERYDVLIDMIGKADAAKESFDRKLARGGKYVLISFLPGAEMSFDVQRMAMDECQIIGIRNGSIQELRDTLAAQAEGRMKPVIDSALPLAEANAALDLIRAGKLMGRVVVSHES
ncbi:MAG: alcohol dehydrogenase catalytic domain-containing protein [Planctomycetota bacterium]|jgi:propanol-preferring alcohol dehydrogenase|nr:alcohol dehydrogenase catalytic domain-containing protein [Planctomycetota bacterium]